MTLDVKIYYITGRQLGPITIPHSWCEECDLTVRLMNRLVDELDVGDAIRVEAKPWIANMIPALLKGGWHPPVLLVGGRVHSQGVVPDADSLREELVKELQLQDVGLK